MKKMRIWMNLWLVAAVLCAVMCGCEDGTGNTFVDEPLEGSTTIKMRNGDNGSTSISFSLCNLNINSANNFVVQSYYDYSSRFGEECDIVNVGTKSGLSSIKKIPESGWTREAGVYPGHGYIFRYRAYYYSDDYQEQRYDEYSYARIYVHSEIISTGGGVIGYEVSYIGGM